MKRAMTILVATLGLTACGEPLTLADAVEAGFQKHDSKFAGMVGAEVGFSGRWKGVQVELYEFRPDAKIEESLFTDMVGAGGFGVWKMTCRNGNLMMISAGASACEELERL